MKISGKIFKISWLLFFIGIGNILWQCRFFKYYIGDIYDAYFNNFVLENFYQNLIGNLSSFKNANAFYPSQNNILFSDNHWFLGTIYAIPRFLGISFFKAYDIFIIIGFIFNYWICYYVFKKMGFSKNSSAIGAFIFAFNQIIIQKIIHIQLNFKIFIPLAILYSKYYFEKKDFRYIAYIITCITLQQIISSYNGTFLALYIIVIFLFFLTEFKLYEYKNFLPKKYSLSISIPIIISSISILILFSLPYIETIKMYDIKIFKTNKPNFNFEFLFTLSNSHIWNFITNYFELKNLQNYDENQFFMGFGVIILLFFGIFKKNYYKNLKLFDKIIIKSTLLILTFFIISDNTTINSIIDAYPPLRYIRAKSRFFYVIFFGFVYYALLSLKYIENNNNNKLKIFYYIVFFLIIFENLSSFIATSSYIDNKEITQYQDIVKKYSNNEEKIILFTQSIKKTYITEQLNIIMAFLTDKKIKIINGYSGFIPFKANIANNCNEAYDILNCNEEIYNDLTKKDFKYAHEKLLIFHDKKLCNNRENVNDK